MSSENDQTPSAAPTRSKSRLVRLLTTKKRTDADQPANARPSRRPGVTNAYSKEQREAALRARGLLPPLSLSQQERELDNTIPIVRHKPSDSVDGETGPSAADLIKKEWEAKNKEAEEQQRKRLDSFKFGGSSSDLSSNHAEPKESDEESKSDVSPSKPDESKAPTTLKTTRSQKRKGLHQASLSQPLVVGVEALRDDHRRSRSVHNKTLPAAPGPESEAPPITPISDLPTEFQAYLNVPPSPVQPEKQLEQKSAAQSQHSSRPSKESNSSARGRLSPLPVDTLTKSSPTPANNNTLVSPSSALSPTDTLVNGSHGRNNSIPRAESGSSSLLTSVDTTSSTTKSSESLTSPGPGGKTARLVTKSVDNGFPVIMESPIEDGPHEALSVEHVVASADVVSSSGHGHDDAGSTDSLPPPPVPERDRDLKRTVQQQQPIKSPKLGAVADQVLAQQESSMVQRKKTINPFKRNQQQLATAEGGTPAKRSLRSVVGTVLRPRRDAENGQKDVQPPTSPTSPRGQAGRAVSPPPSPTKMRPFRQQPAQPAVVRQAVNPVYYSGGDISAQANAIKNDEERRMAELAFMF